MTDTHFLFRSFKHFFKFSPIRLITLFLITLIQGLSQGVTILLLVPLLGLLNPGQLPTNLLTTFLNNSLTKVGLELNLVAILIFFAVCLLAVAFLNYWQSIWQIHYQQDFSYETRKRLYKKIICSDWAFLNGKSKHNHLQVLTTEIPKMANYYYFFLNLANKILFIAAHILVAMTLSLPFSLVVVLAGLMVSLLLRKFINTSRFLGYANVQLFRRMLKRIDDFWLTVKIAKVHESEVFYLEKYNETNKQMLENQYKQVKNKALPQLLFTIAGVFTLVALVFVGYTVVKVPLASILVLILLFARIFPQFAGLNNDLNTMVSNEASVRMVLDMDNKLQEKDLSTKNEPVSVEFNHQLEIRDLTFGYDPQNPLFDHFSSLIPIYAITGITGKSGSGKTSLIDVLAGLQQTSSIYIDGHPLTEDMLTNWRQSLGYLPQDSFFIDGTLRENLVWDSIHQPSDAEILDVLKQVNADHLITRQKKGLYTNISNYQHHFSGGERQRLALARVLLRKPRILLLDEATSALDSTSEKLIMDCLAALKKNVTIVFVTHRDYLRKYFDSCINLDEI